jgi:hypothetical protein
VSVTANPALRFEVRDDGRGFDPSGNGWGQGLTNMRDRLAAVGGRLSVSSEPGDGTVVSGTIPARRLGTSAAAAPGEADTPADPHAGSLAASPIDGDHEALSGGETNRR